MKPELTPSEAVSIMQDAGSTLSLESFKRCLRQDKIPGGLYAASEGQGHSAIYKVFALPFFGWLRNILPLADKSIKKWEARQ